MKWAPDRTMVGHAVLKGLGGVTIPRGRWDMPCRVGDPGSEGLVEGTTLTRLPISRLTAGVIDIDILVVCEVIPQPLSREGDTPSHLTVLKLRSRNPSGFLQLRF